MTQKGPTMNQTVEQIARSLTEAQRGAIAGAESVRGSNGVLVLPIYRDGGKLSRSLVNLGLAGFSRFGAALNKDGKAVRKFIQEQGS